MDGGCDGEVERMGGIGKRKEMYFGNIKNKKMEV